MNPMETKAVKPESEKSQSTKPSVVHEKKSQEGKPEEHTEPESLPKHASDKGNKHTHSEKAVSRSSEQVPSEKPMEHQVTKEKNGKPLTPAVPVESKQEKPSGKSGLDAALDDLIDTLGESEETKEEAAHARSEVSDPMSSTYIEGLGKREVTRGFKSSVIKGSENCCSTPGEEKKGGEGYNE
uniref:Calpastatin n=1 Tax=Otolemur garnettii TaxID=30611 RepID=H0XMC5_OTOGA